MRLYMVRHGETLWNQERRLQGQADAPLSERGREQAKALAPVFRNGVAPELVVSSDLARAHDTARLIGFPEPRLDRRFREIDVGEWTAKLIDDIKAQDAAGYRGWRAGAYTPSGGEDWSDFTARNLAGIRDLVTSGLRTALVVAHGGVIRAACDALIGLPPAKVVPVGPATVTIFDVEIEGDAISARLEGFNLAPQAPVLDAPD
jgi:probable phosphoglycerate mutase